MNRRQIVMFGLAAAVAGPVFARGFQDEIVATLRAQGYQRITVETTLLGRVKITAFKQSNQRQIVINPRTGEVLRDLWLTADGRVAANPPDFDDSGKSNGSGDDGLDDNGSGNSGSGGGSDDDEPDEDKPDEDKPDEDKPDDNSGRGSGGNDD